MSRPLMIAAVALSAYCLLDLAISAFVAILWRTRAVAPADLPPAVRARRLFLLRLVPSATAAVITLVVVTPAFTIFEPVHEGEAIGPALAMLALTGLLQISTAFFTAARSAMLTARIERQWLRSSTALTVDASMAAYAIDAAVPMVALVGVFAPKLIAARSVLDACTPDEVACIVGHERGHLDARDNVKRWIMASLPDTLRWTPMHREMIAEWHHAAEDAADDATTGGDPMARTELAALLLKIVRLAPQPEWESAIVSPFVEHVGLERRVRRLLQPELEPPAPLAIAPMVAVAAITIAVLAAISSPTTLRAIFETFESLVAFGR